MRSSLFALAGAATLAASSEIVDTHYGQIQGFPSDYRSGVTVFKGVPFAQPPIGERRWQAPAAPSNFTSVYVANKFGPECPQQLSSPSDETQDSSPLSSVANVTSEDCLYLNVWKPENATEGDDLPVYLWYYGGRFSSGSGAVLAYDGSGLASKGVVVVTMNYRTGPFGFYAHPDLAAESGHNSSGNYGLLDMQASLDWVNETIQHFGGDPARITVGGQSSGSSCSLDMMYSPLSSDRIFAAIAESGARAPHDPLTASLATSYRNQTEAYQNGIETMAYFNQTTIAGMRNLTMDQLLEVLNEDSNTFDNTQFANVTNFMPPPEWRPVLDGWVLPYYESEYGQALKYDNHANVPILTGNNRDESGSAPFTPSDAPYTVDSFYGNFSQAFGNLTDRFFELYPPGNNSVTASAQSNKFWQDLSRVSSWQFAKQWAAGGAGTNVYTYFWTHAPPTQDLGAFHGSELYYTFNNIPYARPPANWTATDYEIESKMSDYWINFFKTGNPNGDGLPEWIPSGAGNTTNTMELGNNFETISIATNEEIELIEAWFSQLHEY